MRFDRKSILEEFQWITEKHQRFITSADYDGLICASFLHHHLNWQLCGYYDLSSIWISEDARQHRDELIWVDLNILPRQGRAIGGHIVSLADEVPAGFETSCNPNILRGLTAGDFNRKFPFSTLIYLLWLFNIQIEKNLLARLLVLHADATWLKIQHYPENVAEWCSLMSGYNWDWLFQKVDTKTFEKRVDDLLYPELKNLEAVSGFGKLKSKHLGLRARQFQFNPDWEEYIAGRVFNLIGNSLKWTPPELPSIVQRIDGKRARTSLKEVRKAGLKEWLRTQKVFSYAIPSPQIFNHTSFGYVQKSPISDKEVMDET